MRKLSCGMATIVALAIGSALAAYPRGAALAAYPRGAARAPVSQCAPTQPLITACAHANPDGPWATYNDYSYNDTAVGLILSNGSIYAGSSTSSSFKGTHFAAYRSLDVLTPSGTTGTSSAVLLAQTQNERSGTVQRWTIASAGTGAYHYGSGTQFAGAGASVQEQYTQHGSSTTCTDSAYVSAFSSAGTKGVSQATPCPAPLPSINR